MILQSLLDEGRLERRASSRREIGDLMEVASRSLGDAQIPQLSMDGRFNCAYDAALLLATIPLRCAGYRTRGEGHHAATFDALPEVMGPDLQSTGLYLQKCRKIRNLSTYSRSGIVSKAEMKELIARVRELDEAVRSWVRLRHPEYS